MLTQDDNPTLLHGVCIRSRHKPDVAPKVTERRSRYVADMLDIKDMFFFGPSISACPMLIRCSRCSDVVVLWCNVGGRRMQFPAESLP